jgi:hypothetical protein
MLSELTHLLEIRKDMLAKVEVLSAVAEGHSGSAVARKCEQLALQCRQLDDAIAEFVGRVLASQTPLGTA